MIPLDFIASLDGEAKAAALTVYNLMTPKWIEITDDPATLPELEEAVIVRMDADSGGGEMFGLRDGRFPEEWSWFHCERSYWNVFRQSTRLVSLEIGKTPTYWRPIS